MLISGTGFELVVRQNKQSEDFCIKTSYVLCLLLVGWQVSVSLSTNESMPGDPVTLHVRGERGSCVCVATVDKSLYLIKPNFNISPDKVGYIYSL